MFSKQYFLLLFLFFIQIKTVKEEITVFATNEFYAECENGYYILELNVEFSNRFDNYYSFLLDLENPIDLKLKCFIQYKNSSIICIGNLNSNDFDFELGDFIEFPINFPNVEGIIWDYDSFARNIYGKGFIIDDDCPMKPESDFTLNDWGLNFNITDIVDDICVEPIKSLQYKYNFKVKGNFISSELIDNLVQNNKEIEILQDIWIPLNIRAGKIKFRKVNEIQFAFCPFKTMLSKSNINQQFILECSIPIPEGRLLIGDVRIKPFYDFFYIKTDGEIFLENIHFMINRTFEIPFDVEITNDEPLFIIKNNSDKIINNENNKKMIFVNYFILGQNEKNSEKIRCPDKYLFRIAKSEKDIYLYSSELKNYTIALRGILLSTETNSQNIEELNEEIIFNLTLLDNLAENEDNKKAEAKCVIPEKSPFSKKIIIFCSANKISEESMHTNNTDVLLNWNLEKNILHSNIVIKWPREDKKIKHLYSYTINGFSLVNQNYGCLDNKFYFYIYIYNLEFEPDIEFEIPMKNPSELKAICKIYEASILKCYFNLDKKKLEKDSQIDMMINYTYFSVDEQGNRVIFIVEDYDYDYEDFHIKLKTECGNYLLVGLLKGAGLDYIKVGLIILGILCFIIMVIICFICYVIYKIKIRNMKGKYMRYVEEGVNGINQGNNKFKS